MPAIKDLLIDFDPSAKWKINSNAYRLNSSLPRIISSILSKNEDFRSGFLPLHNRMKNLVTSYKTDSEIEVHKISPIKEKYLRRLIQEAKENGCKNFFAISPFYGGGDIISYKNELDILKEYDIPILNHLNEPSIIYDKDLFQDAAHMNEDGAAIYSRIIISDIKKYECSEEGQR